MKTKTFNCYRLDKKSYHKLIVSLLCFLCLLVMDYYYVSCVLLVMYHFQKGVIIFHTCNQNKFNYLRLVARELHVNGCEHAALLAAGDAERHAHVGLQAHARAGQRRVERHVHRLAALARVVLVDYGGVVRHFVSSRPPTCTTLTFSITTII